MSDMEFELGIIPGPVWPDGCGHGGYIASFEFADQLRTAWKNFDLMFSTTRSLLENNLFVFGTAKMLPNICLMIFSPFLVVAMLILYRIWLFVF